MLDIIWILFAAASFCAFMIGRSWSNRFPPEFIIENTIEYLIAEGFLHAERTEDGEWEISKKD